MPNGFPTPNVSPAPSTPSNIPFDIPGSLIAPTSALNLGSFSFLNFEVPEKIDHFGGSQMIEVHYFPGGGITSQDFGSFPPKEISWSGMFFVDGSVGDGTGAANIQSRVAALTQLRVNAQPVQLSFSFYTYLVRIVSFDISPNLEWWQPYTIKLLPIQDLNPWANQVGPPAPTSTGNGGASSTGATGQFTPPPSPNGGSLTAPPPQPTIATSQQASDLAGQSTTLQGFIDNSDNFPTVPPTAVSSLTNFQQSLNSAIQQSLGGVGPASIAALQGSLTDAVSAIGPLAVSKDPGQAAFAAPVNATLGNISTSLAPVGPIGTELTINNPDLNQLALKYYGDASQWQQIAQATNKGGLSQPNIYSPTPSGVLTILIPMQQPITFTGASGVTQKFRSSP